MSRRFGRRQKRALLERIGELEYQHVRLLQAEQNESLLIDALRQVRETYHLIGWKDDCDAIRHVDSTFAKLEGHYLGRQQ